MLGASLLLSACGARLTDEQRTTALSPGIGGGSAAGTSGVIDGGLTGGGTFDGGAAEAAPGAAADPASAGSGGSTGAAVSGPGSSATAGNAQAPAGAAPGADTRAAPPGGNGGATDTGVTANEIVLANGSDISGAVPGLFEDASLATKAYVAYFTAKEGTIYGRKLKLLSLDTRMDTGANRAVALEFCNSAFAGVGSVSAFDRGAAPVLEECGVPDLRAVITGDPTKSVPNVYSALAAGRPGDRGMGNYGWAAEKFPDAVKAAAYLYIDGDVTRQVAEQDMAAAEATLGYRFVYQAGVGAGETNYAPFVQQMKEKGVRYVHFVGAYQQAAGIAKTMQQQGFTPDVWQPTVTAYTPSYLQLAGPAAEGSYVAVAPSLIEEMDGNPELRLYAQWLNQVEPDAKPTGIGQYAWAATALLVEKLKKIGPNLTRKALLDELATVRGFTGNKLFAPQDVGTGAINDCVQIVQVKGGKFVRVEPTEPRAMRCGDGVVESSTGKVISGG